MRWDKISRHADQDGPKQVSMCRKTAQREGGAEES